MADDVTLELGGKKRQLRFDMNALVAIEEKLGVPIDQLGTSGFGVKVVRTLVWAALLHENRHLDEWEVGTWLDVNNFEHVGDAISDALKQVYGEPEGNPQAGRGAGTGK